VVPLSIGETIVHIRGLFKNYDKVEALRGVDFDVYRGEIFGLLGPNGAGKTTLVKILLGLTKKSGGEVRVFGFDPERDPLSVRALVGVVLEETALDIFLTGRENLKMQASLYNLSPKDVERRVEEALSWSRLADAADRLLLHYSHGMRRRMDLAMSLLSNPGLLILDEPTTGLDVSSRRELWLLISDLKKRGVSVILTTHYLEEANNLCDRVCILDHGRVVALGTPEKLKREFVGDMYVLTVRFKQAPQLDGAPLPLKAEVNVWEALFRGPPPKLLETLALLQQSYGGLIDEVVYSQPSLDDVFLRITGKG
jgi:ABC-type multidrug transport system, ATPase component